MIAATKEHLRKAILMSLSLLVILMGLMAFLHTKAGQRIPFIKEIATWLGMRCPADTVSIFQVDQLRRLAFPKIQGSEKAPNKPAMGLLMDHMTLQEASLWVREKGFNCSQWVRGYSFIKCFNVKSDNGVIDEMNLSFNAHGKLMGVNLLRRQLTPVQVMELLSDITRHLRSLLGNPTKSSGTIDVKTFNRQTDSVSIEYNFKDYLAKVTASYLPWSGVVLYEQYLSFADEGG